MNFHLYIHVQHLLQSMERAVLDAHQSMERAVLDAHETVCVSVFNMQRLQHARQAAQQRVQ